MSGYWTIGVGQVGCLYNHTESAEDLDSLLDVASELYELTTDQRNALRWDKVVYFEGEQRATNGDLIELFHTDGELPEDD